VRPWVERRSLNARRRWQRMLPPMWASRTRLGLCGQRKLSRRGSSCLALPPTRLQRGKSLLPGPAGQEDSHEVA
jgi:hypothetical protein